MELSFSQLVKRGSGVCPGRYFFYAGFVQMQGYSAEGATLVILSN